MVSKTNSNKARLKRHGRIRNHISGTASRPRLNVFRSLKNIYAQIIDDEKGVSESKRPYGRLIPLIRNILQFAAIVAVGYIFLQQNGVHNALLVYISKGTSPLQSAGVGLIPILLEALTLIWQLPLTGMEMVPSFASR